MSKPEDWVDMAKIPDPAETKPEDWVEEASITDPEAVQPEDWNTEEDGAWEAPQIPNPAYKGEWAPQLIDNPAYRGEWEVWRMSLMQSCMHASPDSQQGDAAAQTRHPPSHHLDFMHLSAPCRVLCMSIA